MNEKELKDAAKERREGDPVAICSASGLPCRCSSRSGCYAGKPKLDPVPREAVRELRTARLYLEAAKHRLDDIQAPYELTRRHPGPEVREVRRKVVTAIALIDEIGGEL